MMDQTFVSLPFRRHGEPKLIQFFRGFFLSQTRAFPRFLRAGLKSLLVLEIVAIGLQLSCDLRDPIVGVSDLLIERSLLSFDLGQSSFFVSHRPLGRKNFDSGLRRFLVRALVASARFRHSRLGGFDLFLRPVARDNRSSSFCFQCLRFLLEAGDNRLPSQHRIGGRVDRSTENNSFRRNEFTAERREREIARRLFQFQAGGEIGNNGNVAQKIFDERREFGRRVYFVHRPRDRTLRKEGDRALAGLRGKAGDGESSLA